MSLLSKIEWTDATWNPVRGCTKISPGCKHCYAEGFAERFRGVPGHPFEQGFDLRARASQARRAAAVERAPDDFRQLHERPVSRSRSGFLHFAGRHDDASGAVAHLSGSDKTLGAPARHARGPLSEVAEEAHIWWGVSVEDRKYGLPRIADLQAAPAAVRFLSVEPLLEDVGKLPLEGHLMGHRRR